MSVHECPHEEAVVAAVLAGRWPEGCDAALQAHVTDCAVCASVAEISQLLRGEHDALAHVQLPSAGQIWWRAAVRARIEGAQAAARPITWVQAGAGAAAIGAMCAIVAVLWPAAWGLVARAATLVTGFDPGSLQLAMPALPLIERNMMVLLAVGVAVVLTPLLVLYFALSDE
jgi:hypothetical protein